MTEDELTARVGAKAQQAPEPVCFCFAHTAQAITADLAANDGVSAIKVSIKQAVADSLCGCDHLNPAGSCCLGAVNRVIKTATDEGSVATPAGRGG